MSTGTSLGAALDVVLRFGAMMTRAGDAGFRVVDAMKTLAAKLGIEQLAVDLAITSVTATATRGDERLTIVREIGPLGIDAARLAGLEHLTQAIDQHASPDDVARTLDALERTPPLHSPLTVAIAVALASAAFSYLNGGDLPGVLAAAFGGGIGQALRMALARRKLNQYVMTALCAFAAAGACHLLFLLMTDGGTTGPRGIGILASVLFLVPGFPLVAGLLDLLQRQTGAALIRLAYGGALIAAAAFGLGIVVTVAGYAVPHAAAAPADLSVTLALRGIASFAGGVGFALLYNSPWRVALAVGLMALIGNELRLSLHDAGVTLASATFVGAFTSGVLASFASPLLKQPRIVLSVPSIIIMVPGSYAFQATVLFAQGSVDAGLQAAVVVAFVVGGMALGLAAARFVSERRWLIDT